MNDNAGQRAGRKTRMSEITRADVIKMSGGGTRSNFAGVDLSGLDLSGLDLRGRDFTGANLAGANLRGTKLRNANLTRAKLRGAVLDNTDTYGATTTGADFDISRTGKGGGALSESRRRELMEIVHRGGTT
jgi:uncharacterized protein YjbI with pentapeptide repeats